MPSGPGERRYTTRGLLLTESHAINTALARASDRRRRRRRHDHRPGRPWPEPVGRTGGDGAPTHQLRRRRRGRGRQSRDRQDLRARRRPPRLAARRHPRRRGRARGPCRTRTRAVRRHRLHHHRRPRTTPRTWRRWRAAGRVGARSWTRPGWSAPASSPASSTTPTNASVKVVLVGDPRQLPEIDAGGLFRALTNRLPAIELTDNRRQTPSAGNRPRSTNSATATPPPHSTPTGQHGRIVTADTPQRSAADQLVDDWWDTARDEMAGSIMIGLRRADVDDLNHRARARMLHDRRLTGPTIQAAGIELQVGDRIVGLRNSRRHGIVNGTRATITRIDPDHVRSTRPPTTAGPSSSPATTSTPATSPTATPSPATKPKASPSTTPTSSAPRRCTASGATSPSPAAVTPTGSTRPPSTSTSTRSTTTPTNPTTRLQASRPAWPEAGCRNRSRPRLEELAARWRQLHARLHATRHRPPTRPDRRTCVAGPDPAEPISPSSIGSPVASTTPPAAWAGYETAA